MVKEQGRKAFPHENNPVLLQHGFRGAFSHTGHILLPGKLLFTLQGSARYPFWAACFLIQAELVASQPVPYRYLSTLAHIMHNYFPHQRWSILMSYLSVYLLFPTPEPVTEHTICNHLLGRGSRHKLHLSLLFQFQCCSPNPFHCTTSSQAFCLCLNYL